MTLDQITVLLRGDGPPEPSARRARRAVGVLLHHTDTSNTPVDSVRSREERTLMARELVESVDVIHRTSFADIGYNFIVTRYGVVCEGRRGSLEAAKRGQVVRGAHAGSDGDHNATHYGVALEGHYHTGAEIPAEQFHALTELLAALALGRDGHGAFGAQDILEHRDVRAEPTLCPGFAHSVARDIRADVAARLMFLSSTERELQLGDFARVGKATCGVAMVMARVEGVDADGAPSEVEVTVPVVSQGESGAPVSHRSDLLGAGTLYLTLGESGRPELGGALLRDASGKDIEWVWQAGSEVGSATLRLSNPEPDQVFDVPVVGGLARLRYEGALEVRLDPAERTVSLVAASDGKAEIGFNLGFSSSLGHLGVALDDEDDGGLVERWTTALPLEREGAEGGFAFAIEDSVTSGSVLLVSKWPDLKRLAGLSRPIIPETTRVESIEDPGDWVFEGGSWAPINRLARAFVATTQRVHLPQILGPTLGGSLGPRLNLEFASVRVGGLKGEEDGGGIALEGVTAWFGAPGSEPQGLTFRADSIALDEQFKLSARAGRVEWPLAVDEAGAVVSPPEGAGAWLPSIVVHGSAQFVLSFGPESSELRALDDRARVATVVVPGAAEANLAALAKDPRDTSGLEDRFLLAVEPLDADSGFSVGATGASLVARALPREVELASGDAALDGVATVGGRLELSGQTWSMSVRAEAGLPWLEGARGTLELSAVSPAERRGDAALTATADFDAAPGSVWRDPSGCLTLENPRASISLAWSSKGWQPSGHVGGTLGFDASAIGGGLTDFAGEALESMRLEFDRLSLADLTGLSSPGGGEGKGPSVALRFLRPFSGSLWDVLSFDLTKFELDASGVSLAGRVGFSAGGASFEGELPSLSLGLSTGSIRLRASMPVKISGFLELPSGVRASCEVSRREERGLSALEGKGTLRLPGVGDFDVACSVGRWSPTGRREDRVASLAIYVEAERVQPLYPGVVMRRLGLGLGVHRALKGAEAIAGQGPRGLLGWLESTDAPDPGRLESWVPSREPVTLAVGTMLSATAGPSGEPDVYVARAAATLDTSLRLAAFAEAWVLTSLDDARTNAFANRPYARAALSIDPSRPSLSAAMTTLEGARHSIDGGRWVSQLLDAYQMQAGFIAERHRLLWRMGPQSASIDAGAVRLEGQHTVALGVTRSGAWIAGALDIALEAGDSLRAKVGPAEFEISASAGVRGSVRALGGLIGGEFVVCGKGSLRAYFKLEVRARIRFEIKFRVKLGPFKVRVRVRVSIKTRSVSIGVEAALTTSLVLGTGAGASGRVKAKLEANIIGFRVSGTFEHIFGSVGEIERAEQAWTKALSAGGRI